MRPTSQPSSEDPSAWFEPLYAAAAAGSAPVPWARMQPHDAVVQWLREHPGLRQSALVVGCGLGDDAVAVDQAGWQVTAFDISPSAIEECRRRFSDAHVQFSVADLFAPPSSWSRAFSLVIEVHTLQALPPSRRRDAARQIAQFVAPQGRLLLVTLLAPRNAVRTGPPWPLAPEDLELLEQEGLVVVESEVQPSPRWPQVQVLRREFMRPA